MPPRTYRNLTPSGRQGTLPSVGLTRISRNNLTRNTAHVVPNYAPSAQRLTDPAWPIRTEGRGGMGEVYKAGDAVRNVWRCLVQTEFPRLPGIPSPCNCARASLEGFPLSCPFAFRCGPRQSRGALWTYPHRPDSPPSQL